MENTEQKAKEILEKYNQVHIIDWMDKQDLRIKNIIINQVLEIDLDELEDLYRKVKKGVVKKDYNITPIHAAIKEKLDDKQAKDMIELGNNVLKNNQFGVITMAGGQGTRLRT